jgi:hypothetical protein
MIKIVNKRLHTPTGDDYYIGRPNCLGNPYSHLDTSKYGVIKVASREKAVELYDEWLEEQLKTNPKVQHEFSVLMTIYRATGSLNLVCWCAPKKEGIEYDYEPLTCHGQPLGRRIIEASKA